MNVVDEKAEKVRLFGAEAADLHTDTINNLHRFAQLTGCKPGRDVIGWYSEMTTAWQEACSRQYRPTTTPEDGAA